MYKLITTNGTELGYTEALNYIKISSSGAYVSCAYDEAVGIAYKSVAYNLFGRTEIEGAETVLIRTVPLDDILAAIDSASAKMQADIDYMAMMSDIELDAEEESEVTE